MILIAEIGNNHFGDFARAKEMILHAHDAGADLVKLQAFEPKDLVGKGSMPPEFYAQCAFTFDQYKELIDFGRLRGITVFYSVFSGGLSDLKLHQVRHKVSAGQTKEYLARGLHLDYARTFVSFPASHLFHAVELKNAIPLYAGSYLPDDPELYRLDYLKSLRPGLPFGYSDHTYGLTACEVAVKHYGARVIEKHFTLDKEMKFAGTVFRDTVHGASKKEFAALARMVKML